MCDGDRYDDRVTEIVDAALEQGYLLAFRQRSGGWDLDQVSYFLVVAATLLDLKAARLLPSGEVEDEEDLALLEARDLLFARLLQYRAYKEVAAVFAGRMAAAARRFPRRVPLEPRFAQLLPEVLFAIGPQEFAALAARALTPKTPPVVSTDHIHAPFISIREQAMWPMVMWDSWMRWGSVEGTLRRRSTWEASAPPVSPVKATT